MDSSSPAGSAALTAIPDVSACGIVHAGREGVRGGANKYGWSRSSRLRRAWHWRHGSKRLAMVSSSRALAGEASCAAARLKKPAPSSAYQRMLCRPRI